MSPYLSVVAASRNDDHGGDPLIRTQIFINNFARQCEKYRLPAELIIVDWNPVPDRPGLAAALKLPSETTSLQGRVITVPAALHRRLKYADKLPFFQMIAKNAGIRRAQGQFVLATNIDILFSNELIKFISLQRLDLGKLYRVDRYDIQNGLSCEGSLEETLEYAWKHPVRTLHRYKPEKLVQHLYGAELFRKTCIPDPVFRGQYEGVEVVQEANFWQLRPQRSLSMDYLHTNACGDFTLLSRLGWNAIRGYPEFEAFSFHIDSIGMLAAHYEGYVEVSLLPPSVCFHIEHRVGSGWTPEGEDVLFNRLRQSEILTPEWPVLAPLAEEMRAKGKALEFNHAGWGLVDFALPEQAMGDTVPISADKLSRLAFQAARREVSAIQPIYDLDRLTLAHERRAVATSNQATGAASAARVVLYIPDSDGHYSEERSIAYQAHLASTTTLVFRLDEFAHQFPLRFDPCACPGLIEIDAVTAFDALNNKMIWEFDSSDADKFAINGTGAWADGRKKIFFRPRNSNDRQPLRLVSTGNDPQLIFPALPRNIGFPLVISVEMKILPFR